MDTPIDYNLEFEKALLLLNAQQRDAVESIEGPVMVLAGPGTGKTHLLSARIGNILKRTDAMPNNILCLSFTDAGVKAMRDRLLTLIGPDAHKIHLYTYHAFCNTVIKENAEVFGHYELELISEIEQIDLIEGILDALPFNHPLVKNINVPYTNRQRLLNLFKNIKTEGWTITYLKERIDAYKASLPNDEAFRYQVNRANFKKGDLKQDAIDHAVQQMNVLESAIDLYPIFLTEMKQRNRYDYDDMILWVNHAFATEERVLRNYQEKYQYILVDEFQDTNGSQNQLLKHLTSYWDQPNIFIVGDDDQSIYEFQGAMLKSMVDFYRDYQPFVKVVVLTENYRSSQRILDASAALISHNQHRIVHEIENQHIDKLLTARNPLYCDCTTPVQLNQYENHYQEVIHVVDQIIELSQSGVALNEIAVLFAKHQQAVTLQQYLTHCQIPYETKKKVNILHEPIILYWMTLLEYLSMEFQEAHSGQAHLFALLHHPCWEISQNAIDQIVTQHQNHQDHQWIDLLSANEDTGFQKFIDFRANLLSAMGGDALTTVLEKSLNLSGLLFWATQQKNVSWQLSILNTFTNYCSQEIVKAPKLILAELLAGIKNLEAHQIGLQREQFVGSQNAVQLVTAHSSKGLEYEHVFLLDVMETAWAKSGSSNNFKLPNTITLSTATDETEASRRLFFVAITRAKKSVQIGFSRNDTKGKAAKKLLFIDELANLPSTAFREVIVSNEKVQALQSGLLQSTTPKTPLRNQQELQKILSHFTLSVHSLQSYLRCPLSFYYDFVLKLPSAVVPATIFGSVLHSWLEWLFREMKLNPTKSFGTLEASLTYYQRQIERKKGLLSTTTYERYLQQGKALVQAYYIQNIQIWNKKVDIELNIQKVTIEGVPVSGIIDKVEYDENGNPTIIDYKSGAIDEKKLAVIKPGQAGGDYRRQLWFYKLLFEGYRANGPKVKAGKIAYLQANAEGQFPQRTIEFEHSEEELIKELIKDTYQKIMDLSFDTGCGKPDCKWCNFVKNSTIDTFAEEDLLDD